MTTQCKTFSPIAALTIGGVINIITRRPTEKVTTQARVTLGAYGLNQQTINNSGKVGDISWVVGYNRTQAENNYPFSIPEANFEGTRKNDALKSAVEKAGVDVEVRTSGCLEVCQLGPVVFYSDDRTWYTRVNSNIAETIVNEHLVKGNKVIEHCYPPESV